MRCAEKVAAAYRLGHKAGYEEGLDAAREAVEVLLKEWWEIKELKSMVELNRAIAAIDALKEK